MSFFVKPPVDGLARLEEADAAHALKSLRMKAGDRLALAWDGKRYEAALEIRAGEVFARVLNPLPGSEPACRVTLYQGLPKGDKMDAIVQKCTEIGVHRIVPCLFSRCVARWEGGDKKLQRWGRIAKEAAMQSGRALIPGIGDCLSFPALCEALKAHRQALVAWEEGGQSLQALYTGARDIAVVIGPEGGISGEEAALLGAQALSLGPRILRTETAGMAALAMLLTLSGDMA